MKFSPAFIEAHKRLAPAIPIKRFASIVNPTSIGLDSTQDFYAPVRFTVQASGKPNDATGIIRLDVAVQKNPDWLRDMKEQLTSTLKLQNVDLKTVTGMPLEQVPLEQLARVGKLVVYDGQRNEPVRLSSLPPHGPPEYRVTKVQELKEWAQKLHQGKLPEVVAAVLKGKDVHQVEAALLSDGAVAQAIQTELAKNGDWPEFVRLHQSSSTKTTKPVEAQQLLEKVSRQILAYINRFIGAASQQVKEHIVAEQFRTMNTQKGDTFKPVLSSLTMSSATSSGKKENPTLYRTLVEDALAVPMLQKNLVSFVYNFSPNAPKTKLIAASRPLTKRIASNHHPWYAHIHHTLLPIKGTYPSDYLVKHTKQDMSARAPFIGDVNKTYEAYHRFSGIANAPPPCRIKKGIILEPIACHGNRGRETKKAKAEEAEEVEGQLMLNRAMPKLIPISADLPTREPVREMPKLIPISADLPMKETVREMPKLIPISADLPTKETVREMPKLIPIQGHYPHGKNHHGSNDDDMRSAIGSSLYNVIGNEEGEGEEGVDAALQHTEADFAHLPDVNDIFK